MILHTKSELLELAAAHAPFTSAERRIRELGAAAYRTPRGFLVDAGNGVFIEIVPEVTGPKIFWPQKMPKDAKLIEGEKL